MSVLKWRLRSSVTGSSPKSPGFLLSLIVRILQIIGLATLLSACVHKARKPDLVFDSGKLSEQEWELADKTCEFEAAKAVIPIKIAEIAGEQFRRIYILCVESKGVKYLGTEDRLGVSQTPR
ncbi:hypothetical protein FEZ63_21530 [Microvirga brassicacearum]|uniref:Uncharacterized protein n=1 Tax=Microvirga brassicacearum TaxID=2580413 RepID=A0A5N3P4Y9_9HYPH|nr:hypothetical protein FEZ63_21530 [Microvirga brassicacearum]